MRGYICHRLRLNFWALRSILEVHAFVYKQTKFAGRWTKSWPKVRMSLYATNLSREWIIKWSPKHRLNGSFHIAWDACNMRITHANPSIHQYFVYIYIRHTGLTCDTRRTRETNEQTCSYYATSGFFLFQTLATFFGDITFAKSISTKPSKNLPEQYKARLPW